MLDGLAGHSRQIHNPIPLSFALAYDQAAGAQVEVLELQVEQFAGSQSGMGQDGQTSVLQTLHRVGGTQTMVEVSFQLLALRVAQMARQGVWAGQGLESKDAGINGLTLVRLFT
jgi:hypothetical protein